MNETNETNDSARQYVLVIKDAQIALGPFSSRDDAEYAAMDYYGTAITGASIREAFLIAELRIGDPETVSREHARHVAALMANDA